MHEDDQIEVKKIQLQTWKKILKIVFKSKKRLVLLIFFAGLLAALDVLFPLINNYAIKHYFMEKNLSTLPLFIIVNVVVALAFGLSVWGFIRQAGYIEATTSYELRKQAFENIQRLPFSYFDKTPQGWLMARLTSDARKLSMIISWSLVDFVWAGLSMVLIMIVLIVSHPVLALIVLIAAPLMLLIAFMFRKLILNRYRIVRKHNSQVTAKFSESFLGAKTTKSLVIEEESFEEFRKEAAKLRKASVTAIIYSAIFSSVILVISYVALALTMYEGSLFFLEGKTFFGIIMTIPLLQLFLSYTVNFFEPIMSLSRTLSDFQSAQASAERIIELIETKPELTDSPEVIEKYGTIFEDKKENWEALIGDVEFKEVTFSYLENETILENFNLKIKAGTKVALVGHTGSGKTTVVNLLARFYEPVKGTIFIDGIDYKERSIHWLHNRLGYVLQSPHLFSTTIMENIRYGKLDATDEEVISAAKSIGADQFIEKLELKYDTNVGEGGNFLSVGQKQLISFARAILANPQILILDEATSSIDSETEKVIQEATNRLLAHRTSFIVAHRLSTIVDCDVIILMEMGHILEMGTHQELLAKRGSYFNLYKAQFMEELELNLTQEL